MLQRDSSTLCFLFTNIQKELFILNINKKELPLYDFYKK
jgi:hypothetical protein